MEEEVKVEVVFPESIKGRVLKAMLTSHPYEEPAYDVIRLGETNVMGLGRVGYLTKDMTLQQFAEFVKQQLDVPAVRVVGDLQSKVSKVALVGGDGNKYIYAAKRAGADVFLTGDMYFHTAQDAQAIDLQIVDPGHHVEKVMIAGVAKMAELCEDKNIWLNSSINDPYRTIFICISEGTNMANERPAGNKAGKLWIMIGLFIVVLVLV